MILGIGTDIVDIRRIDRSLQRFGDRIVRKILCDSERRETAQLAAYLARQFAAKEAVSKALGTGMRGGVLFTNIEVLRRSTGAPIVTLSGGAQSRAAQLGITRIHLSMSDERDYAVAYAIVTNDL